MSKFRLSDSFLEEYKTKKVDWGPLGEFIYLRTYSRFIEEENRNEQWWETVRRVVEGTFNTQKDHCAKLRLPWNNVKSQRSAKIMYEKIFSFKFTPSGRGLFLMGTDFAEKRGAAALSSCAYVTTEDIETRGSFAFSWAMDALMLGLGVGFDTKGAGKIIIKAPKKGDGLTFKVPDSREGWVEGLELVLDGYFYERKIPEFDFSDIREYGLPIKGFGGVSCLTGDTKVFKDRKKSKEENSISIKELFDIQEREKNEKYRGRFQKIKIRSLDEDNNIFYRNNLIQVIDNGIAPVFEIKTKKGYKIKATANHRFMNYKKEWKFVSDFEIGNYIAVNGEKKTANCIDCNKPISRRATRCVECNNKNQINENSLDNTARQRKECRSAAKDYCEFCGKEETRFEIHHIDENPQNNHFSNLLNLCSSCHRTIHYIKNTYGNPYSHKYLSFDEIISIEYIGEERVFDLEMEYPDHNFIANGFVSHNSGPEPLIELYNDIKKLLNKRIGEQLSSTDIVDIMNLIARTVIAGNVRRSAEIAFGDPEDKEYVTMKDYNLHPKELKGWRWASNNSIFAEVGKTDYNKIAKSIMVNGEPGIIWLDNARKFGRIKDGENRADKNIGGTNPSLRRGTKVLTTNGIFPIEELQDKEFKVKNLNGEISVAKCFLSGENKRLFKITLAGGHEYYCTPEHKWPIYKFGSFKKVLTTEIKEGDYLPLIPKQNKLFDGQEGTYDEGFLFGYNLGDGWIAKRKDNGKYQIGFILNDEDYNSKIKDVLLEQLKKYGYEGKFNKHDKNSTEDYEINTQRESVSSEFIKKGFINKKYGLPKFIFEKASESFRKGFIDGLFSADGSIDKNDYRITLSTAYKKLAEDISELLGFYGIKTAINKQIQKNVKFPNGKDYGKEYIIYRVRISDGKSKIHFKNLFKLSNKRKQDLLENIEDKSRSFLHTNCIKITSIEETQLEENVWDITVYDETSCFQLAHCITGNCGEIFLESTGLCNLIESFPSRHESYEEYKETLKYAYLYGKTITLLSTHWPETNQVVMKNRRIGLSQTGIIDAFAKHGRREMLDWCDNGYNYLRELDEIYSNWLCIPKSIKISTTKPSGCQIKETLVNTKEGILSLEEMGDINGEQWQEYSGETTKGKEITKFYVNGKVETKIITTQDGNELECSLNHKYIVMGEDDISWKQASDIKIGDKLVCSIGDYKGKKISQLKLVKRPHPNCNIIVQPSVMTEKLAWLIGMIYGDGSVHKRGLRISFNRKEASLVFFIKKVVKDLFDINTIVDDDHSIYINSTWLLEYLKENKMLKEFSSNLRIPKVIRSSSNEIIKAFITGLWRADGGILGKTTWSICTVSKRFSLELLAIGRAIGLNLKIKNAGPGGWGSKDRYIISLRTIGDKNDRYRNNKLLDRKIGDNLWVDEVTAIESSENYTYDISVPEDNEYIANGVISHNTTSLLPGVSPGIHYPHAEYYIRRVRISADSKLIEPLRKAGYEIEPLSSGSEKTKKRTLVVSFPVYERNFIKQKEDVSIWEQVKNVIDYQTYWSDNSVSCTITFKKEEAEDIPRVLEAFEDQLKAISLLPLLEHGYEQAPYETITKERYIEMTKNLKQPDFGGITTVPVGEKFCSNDSCEIGG